MEHVTALAINEPLATLIIGGIIGGLIGIFIIKEVIFRIL